METAERIAQAEQRVKSIDVQIEQLLIGRGHWLRLLSQLKGDEVDSMSQLEINAVYANDWEQPSLFMREYGTER